MWSHEGSDGVLANACLQRLKLVFLPLYLSNQTDIYSMTES